MSIEKIADQVSRTITAGTPKRVTSVDSSSAKHIDAARTQPAPEAESASPKIEQIAERLESYIRSVSRSLEFKVDANSGRTIISVLDAETGDLIRQIPNEEVVRFAELAEEQTIVLLNETV
jgi:flagellar protein FlaG